MIRALTLIVALATSARTDAVLCSSFDDEASCDGCTFEGECVWDSAREACKAVADSENCGAIGLLDACEDSSSWYMKKENKNCKWVSKNDKRCKKTAKVKAAEACPTACAEARRLDACTDSSSWDLSQFCVDSASWEYDDGKGCAWVAEKAAEGDDKCDKKDAAGVKAKHACVFTCDKCPGDCVDSASWEYDDGKGCAWVAEKAAEGDDKCGKKDAAGVKAKHACPVACDECPGDKGCDWVASASGAESLENRCSRKNAAKEKARNACPVACGTCPEDDIGASGDDSGFEDSESWYYMKARQGCEWLGKQPLGPPTNFRREYCKRKGKEPAEAACAASCGFCDESDDATAPPIATAPPTYFDWRLVGSPIFGESGGSYGDAEGDGYYGDAAGSAVSLSFDGMTVAVGGPGGGYEEGADAPPGVARVYKYTRTSPGEPRSWTQLGGDIRSEVRNDRLGTSVSLSGDGSRVAVGAPGGISSSWASTSGTARVYEWDPEAARWAAISGGVGPGHEGDTLKGENTGDLFGDSIALSRDGTVVVVGAPGNANQTSGGDAENDDGCQEWGDDANTAPGDPGCIGVDIGSVRIYEWHRWSVAEGGDGSWRWRRRGGDIDGTWFGDEFGKSVAIDGTGERIAVGAWGDDDWGDLDDLATYGIDDDGNFGSVEVRRWNYLGAGSDGSNVGDWPRLGPLFVGDGEGNGLGGKYATALSDDGEIVAMSSSKLSLAGGGLGVVRVFKWTANDDYFDGLDDMQPPCYGCPEAGSWAQLGSDVTRDANAWGGGFCADDPSWQIAPDEDSPPCRPETPCVSKNCDWVAEAPANRCAEVGDRGRAASTACPAACDACGAGDDEEYGFGFGAAITLSADGSRLAVAAPNEDGVDTDSGVIRVYKWESGSGEWAQLGSALSGTGTGPGDSASGALFGGGEQAGHAISLSGDGRRLAVGAPLAGPEVPYSGWEGAVRVYEM